jgi:hypothetical protein
MSRPMISSLTPYSLEPSTTEGLHAHNLLTSRSSISECLHRSIRGGGGAPPVACTLPPFLQALDASALVVPAHACETDDVLSGAEKKAIEKAFYLAGAVASSAAADMLIGSFGWTLTDDERFAWFPEEVGCSAVEPPSRHRPPVTLAELLTLMRCKKAQFLALSQDKDENESLATFVALGGNYDGTGTADISTLIEAVHQLRGDAPRRKTITPQQRVTTVMKVPSKRASSDEREDDMEEQEEDGSADDNTAMRSESALSVHLRTMPRLLRFPEFVDALQSLRNAATAGGGASTSPQRSVLQLTIPGTPSDSDLQVICTTQRLASTTPSPSSGGVRASVSGVHPQVGGGFASAIAPQSAPSHRGVGLLGSAPFLRSSLEEEWSDVGDDAPDRSPEAGKLDNDWPSASCRAAHRSIEACVNAFHSRRAPENTLDKIMTVPPSNALPMSVDGTSLQEILLSRRYKTGKKTTKPITPLMMIRDSMQQSILAMESAELLEKQMMEQTKKRSTVSTTKVKRASKCMSPLPRSYSCTGGTGVEGMRARRSQDEDVNEPNAFVSKLARHIAWNSARTKKHKTTGDTPAQQDTIIPSASQAICRGDVRPASAAAKRNAPALVSRWQRRSVGKLAEARELALELALSETSPLLQKSDATRHYVTDDTKASAAALHPPAGGFEAHVSRFLAYPHPGVYRRSPSAARGGVSNK